MATAETAKSLAPMTVVVCHTNTPTVSWCRQPTDVVDRQQPRPGHNHRDQIIHCVVTYTCVRTTQSCNVTTKRPGVEPMTPRSLVEYSTSNVSSECGMFVVVTEVLKSRWLKISGKPIDLWLKCPC